MNTNQKIRNNVIPQLGFGTYGLEDKATEAITHAFQVGYRHIDTADVYGSHQNVAEAIQQSNVPRSEIFITTKLWRSSLPPKEVGPTVERFLNELQTEYIDLLLIHRPSKSIPVADTLGAMAAVQEAGKVRHLGVSNFNEELIQECLDSGVTIINNQIEYCPSFTDDDLVEYCHKNQVQVTAYSPLGVGKDLDLPTVLSVAEQQNCDPAQVVLAWLMKKGLVAIPRSSQKSHIKTNFQAQQLELSDQAIKDIDGVS